MDRIAFDMFGKDHWSLLAYLETLCVDGKLGVGAIDNRRVRCNSVRHPLKLGVYSPAWSGRHGTRLRGYAPDVDPSLQLADHDDWDCLDDLEAAGLVEILNLANGWVRLTPIGSVITSRLRYYKSKGLAFADFADRLAEERAPAAV